MYKRVVAVNAQGLRIGEDHQQAKLSNSDVELILRLYQGGGWSYGRLAIKFDVSKSCIAWICSGKKRMQTPASFREVHLSLKRRGKLRP